MNAPTPSDGSRVLLVTGGGSGIGAAVARRADDDGWTVVITGRRPEPLDTVAASCRRVRALPADMSRAVEVDRVVSTVLKDLGRIDAAVANAGVMAAGALADTPPEEWDRIMAVNLTGPYLLARACLPALRSSRGSFVGVGSIAGMRAPAGASAYAVSKAALSMLVSTIAVDEARHGVRANVVNPGWVRTEMADGEMTEFGDALGLDLDEAYEAVTALVPQRRAARPHEVAAAVMWLIGDEASYVNGAALTVDGGTTLVDPGTVPFTFDVRDRP
jgi:meso-butanediol dehydrogenase/(S,S)-butanediol dehydrogenase/diacetyl reductase